MEVHMEAWSPAAHCHARHKVREGHVSISSKRANGLAVMVKLKAMGIQ
jgi:hypothetical protein